MLECGDKAPDFSLPTVGDGEVSLSGELAQAERGVIVYFYPRAMTPGCTKQACDFRDSWQALTEAGYRVIGVSPDKVERLAKFTERDSLNFPLASDVDHTVMEAYEVWGEKKNYGKVTVVSCCVSCEVNDKCRL